MSEENIIGYYAVLPATVLFNKELKPNEKLLYAIITALANKEGYCFASNNYLAKLLGVKAHTISIWVSNLSKMKFVCVELIKNEKNEVIQRRIYPNDSPYNLIKQPYVTNITYPCVIKNTEGMSQKRQYNNINIKIDRFFNFIINKEKQNPENFNKSQELEFFDLLEKLELNYTENLLKIFTKDNVEKLKIIIFALKEIFLSNKNNLLMKVKREELMQIYENCKIKEKEYRGTEKEISNFFEYYYRSLIRKLEKA